MKIGAGMTILIETAIYKQPLIKEIPYDLPNNLPICYVIHRQKMLAMASTPRLTPPRTAAS